MVNADEWVSHGFGLFLQDYWLSLLYKRLVGPEVLETAQTADLAGSKRVRLYLHCANKQRYCRSLVEFLWKGTALSSLFLCVVTEVEQPR